MNQSKFSTDSGDVVGVQVLRFVGVRFLDTDRGYSQLVQFEFQLFGMRVAFP